MTSYCDCYLVGDRVLASSSVELMHMGGCSPSEPVFEADVSSAEAVGNAILKALAAFRRGEQPSKEAQDQVLRVAGAKDWGSLYRKAVAASVTFDSEQITVRPMKREAGGLASWRGTERQCGPEPIEIGRTVLDLLLEQRPKVRGKRAGKER